MSQDRRLRETAVKLSSRLRHRGPDWSGSWLSKDGRACLCHERLSIVDVTSMGTQPLTSQDDKIALTVNGEIYNHRYLRREYCQGYEFKSESDCEVIIPLYQKFGADCVKYLDGMFAWVLHDEAKDVTIAARDHIGICPLYKGTHIDGSIWFASEAKAVQNCAVIEMFPAGSTFYKEGSQPVEMLKWYQPDWVVSNVVPKNEVDLTKIRTLFEQAVVKRLMADVPFGVLLSGGLDSSLVAAVAQRHISRMTHKDAKGGMGEGQVWYTKLHSFCVGLKGGNDLLAARKVAKAIGTVHHEINFTVQDGLDAIEDVIHKFETYDVTTIRAGTPMYLLSRVIKSTGTKMVLSGEGSDEMFGGYLYFHNAPSTDALHHECVTRLKELPFFDCLRANKATQSWGLEARVPFLDRDLLNYVMDIDPVHKMPIKGKRMEKYILRKAFDTPDDPYLPQEVLWRQKEQFSDGVGYSWVDSLKEKCEAAISDDVFKRAKEMFPHNTPLDKEAFYYRQAFERIFAHKSVQFCVLRWTPKWSATKDPSGRAIGIHEKHDTKVAKGGGDAVDKEHAAQASSKL